MLKNYFKTAFRNLWRNKGYASINLLGLAIGLATFILISLFIKDELSYDRYNIKADRIFMMKENANWTGKWEISSMTSAPMGPALVRDYPEVENQVRIVPSFKATLKYRDKAFSEYPNFADASIFDIFTLPLVYGQSANMLKEKNTVALSQTMSRKLFGNENPVGKVISYNGDINLKVDGVFEDVPHNSHIQFDVLISFETLTDESIGWKEEINNWGPHNNYTYLLLHDAGQAKQLERQFPAFIQKYMGKESQAKYRPFLEPLTSLHLKTVSASLKIFTIVSIFILLLACINYMNLATARSGKRAREVGMRKVVGASRRQIIRQFLGESMILTFIAFFLALSLAEIFLPLFRNITQKPLFMTSIFQWKFLLFLIGTTILVGLLSGFYSAFYLSFVQPVIVLKGKILSPKGQNVLRKSLVIFQFIVSIFLVIASITIYRQVDYMKNCDLGFDKENVIYLELNSPNIQEKVQVFKQELLQNPEIINATASFYIIGRGGGGWGVKTDRMAEETTMTAYLVDPDFLSTFNIKLKSGRDFLKNSPSEYQTAFLLNELAVKKLELGDGVGKQVEMQEKRGIVVGVMKDFNFASLHNEKEPLIITLNNHPNWFHFLNLKIRTNDFNKTISFIEKKWKEIEPVQPFNYRFLDETLDKQYAQDSRMAKIILIFTVLAVIIACLGLLGLTMFTIEQKNKEIGIRKVFGGSVSSISRLLAGDFLKWVIISFVIASPLAWFVMNKWLQNFPYREGVSIGTYLISFLIIVAIAMATVFVQIHRAARMNPVDALKYE